MFTLKDYELPIPTRRSDGRLQVDFNRHAAALDLYDGASLYLFLFGRDARKPNFRGFPALMGPEWKRLMRSWLQTWVVFLAERGIGYDRFSIYLADEYIGDEIYALARFIKEEVDPRIQIYANSRGDRDGKQLARIAPYVDLWCWPDRPATHRGSAAEIKVRENAQVWRYAALGAAKALPPLSYYRLQPWRAFARGETGCGFWTYCRLVERGFTEWDDWNRKGGPYEVVYGPRGCPVDTSGEHFIPSRRWEAWREGIEDYEYLVQLQKAVEVAKSHGYAAAASQAEQLLDQVVRQVLDSPDDPNVVYEVRRLLTQQLLTMKVR